MKTPQHKLDLPRVEMHVIRLIFNKLLLTGWAYDSCILLIFTYTPNCLGYAILFFLYEIVYNVFAH